MDWMTDETLSVRIAQIKARIDYLRAQLETKVVKETEVQMISEVEAPREPTEAEKLKLSLLKGKK